MIDDLVEVFGFQSVIGQQFIGVKGRAGLDVGAHFRLNGFLPSVLQDFGSDPPLRSSIPITGVLSFPPVPVMQRSRLETCIFRDF